MIQVAKRKSECILALAQLNPIYISPNTEEGKRECEKFFPEEYAQTLDEEDMVFEILSTHSEISKKDEVAENIGEGVPLDENRSEHEIVGEGTESPNEEGHMEENSPNPLGNDTE